MNYAAEWDIAHRRRLMRAEEPDDRVKEFARGLLEEWCRLSGRAEIDNGDLRIFEIGCGTGVNVCWLAEQGFQAFGIDSSRTAVWRAKDGFVVPGIIAGKYAFAPRIWCADITDREVHLDGQFHAVIDVCCLENLDEQEFKAALKQIARMLQPGGSFFSLTASPDRDDALTECGKVRKPRAVELIDQLLLAGLEAAVLRAETHIDRAGNKVANWRVIARKVSG